MLEPWNDDDNDDGPSSPKDYDGFDYGPEPEPIPFNSPGPY